MMNLKNFTMNFGGCVIGDKEIYGIYNTELLGNETIIDINMESQLLLEKNLIIGFDGFGNPVFINKLGKIYCYDVDTNNHYKISENLFSFLLEELQNI